MTRQLTSGLAAGVFLYVTALGTVGMAADDFKPLFDGKTLDGWTQHGGKAIYTVEDGVIVGSAVLNTQNSFLCTDKHYDDFVLDLEFLVDPELNSGIQIRSNVFDEATTIDLGDGTTKDIPADRVHGYQVEIDPSPRAFSGGIYDEGRRGWLQDLSENKAAREAFKPGEWNHYRIECHGDSIRTWVNGVAAADLDDSLTPSGVIALQVHGVGNDKEKEGIQVRWRYIKIDDLTP